MSRRRTKHSRKQIAALCWRRKDDACQVLLVTSRETRRWVIPKGWPMPGLCDYLAAGQEAFEEAGATGTLGDKPFGTYKYQKLLKSGEQGEIEVTVFALRVTTLRMDWPEKQERKRKWFTVSEASKLVAEPSLKAMILKIGRSMT